MAAKFTAGDSIRSTRTTARMSPPRNVKTTSDALKGGSTMPGMPGYINAHEPENMGGMKGGKAFGPHRGGLIGEKGGSGAKSMGKGKAAGTTIANYKSASMRSPGTLKEANATGSHKVHTASRGGSGKMEKLKARTSMEGRRGSSFY